MYTEDCKATSLSGTAETDKISVVAGLAHEAAQMQFRVSSFEFPVA
jgi:hypothetical protein